MADNLLKMLSPFHSELPLTSRTLLETSTFCSVESLGNGDFFCIGIKKQLQLFLTHFVNFLDLNISLRFNIDGLPYLIS